MNAPTPAGHRLAIIAGSGTGGRVLGGGDRRTIATTRGPAELDDHGPFIVVRRHGPAELVPAHRLDHHRTIEAIAAAGCDRVLALNSVGSLRPDWPVGTVVAVDDFVAPWVAPSFYDDARGHSVPGIDERWRAAVLTAWREVSAVPIVDGGTYVQTTGPRFETRAEIRWFATFADVVGMTLAAECILAGEAGLAYASVCVVDNLANGLADQRLSLDEYTAAREANAARLAADIDALVARLAPTH